MEPKDWISLAGIASTLIISLTTLYISHRRELRQEETRKKTLDQEHKQRIEEKRLEAQYSKLHEKRADVIAKLYQLLVKAEQDAISLTRIYQVRGEPSQQEKSKQAFHSTQSLREFLEQNRIYFREESCEKISNFAQELYRSLTEFTLVVQSLSDDHATRDTSDKWIEVWDKLGKNLPPIKADIEREFREILGL